MTEITLVLIGVALISLGWNWGGVTDNRTGWAALGATGIVLAGSTVFAHPDGFPSWSLTAVAAIGALVAAGVLKWGAANDKTLGLYGLVFAGAAGLSTGGFTRGATYSILSLSMTLVAVAGGLVFLTAVTPRSAVMRNVIGWLLVFLGFSIGFLAYCPSLGVTFGTAGLG